MDDSSVELPILKVIKACEEVQDFFHAEALKLWQDSPKIRADNAEHEDAAAFASANAFVKGPTKLLELCCAARDCGETKVRISAADFWPIHAAFRYPGKSRDE